MDFSKNDFSKAREGERAWHFQYGWGTISNVHDGVGIYFKADVGWEELFLFDGRFTYNNPYPILYWDELKIDFDVPQPPKRMIPVKIERWGLMNKYGGIGTLRAETKEAVIDSAEGEETMYIYPVKITCEGEIPE